MHRIIISVEEHPGAVLRASVLPKSSEGAAVCERGRGQFLLLCLRIISLEIYDGDREDLNTALFEEVRQNSISLLANCTTWKQVLGPLVRSK